MNQGSLRELLAVDNRKALEFFFLGLKDVSESGAPPDQLLYSASVLAHYATTSIHEATPLPTPANLDSVFEGYVTFGNTEAVPESLKGEFYESAGSQCLLMTGFFESQMRRRYSINWFEKIGVSLFVAASRFEEKPKRKDFLQKYAEQFPHWRRRCAKLSRELRDVPFLMSLPTQGTLQ